jgi:hypothetical protein
MIIEVILMSKIDELANEIVTLNESEQQLLWKYVADLSFLRGLFTLSDKYRERLRIQEELDRSATEVMTRLKHLREDIASDDYHV